MLMGASARKLSTLASREPARVGSLLSNQLSGEAVQLLPPAVAEQVLERVGFDVGSGCGSVGQCDQRGRESGADSRAEGERDRRGFISRPRPREATWVFFSLGPRACIFLVTAARHPSSPLLHFHLTQLNVEPPLVANLSL